MHIRKSRDGKLLAYVISAVCNASEMPFVHRSSTSLRACHERPRAPVFARATKYSCPIRKSVNHRATISARNTSVRSLPTMAVSQADETVGFPVNRLGFPGIFSSPLFALYGSCSFTFLETNIARISRRSYFCLLPARGFRGWHYIRRKVVLDSRD